MDAHPCVVAFTGLVSYLEPEQRLGPPGSEPVVHPRTGGRQGARSGTRFVVDAGNRLTCSHLAAYLYR